MIEEIYRLITDLGFFGFGGLMGLLGEIIAVICVAIAVLTPVMIIYSTIQWMVREARYDN